MACQCKEKKSGKGQSPDCMASKSTVVKTPEGDEVEVHFNMGTGEVTYQPKKECACGGDGSSPDDGKAE